MTPKIHFFIFCSATLTIRAKSGLRPCSYYFPELIQKLVSELSYFRINSESFVDAKVPPTDPQKVRAMAPYRAHTGKIGKIQKILDFRDFPGFSGFFDFLFGF